MFYLCTLIDRQSISFKSIKSIIDKIHILSKFSKKNYLKGKMQFLSSPDCSSTAMHSEYWHIAYRSFVFELVWHCVSLMPGPSLPEAMKQLHAELPHPFCPYPFTSRFQGVTSASKYSFRLEDMITQISYTII